MPRHGSATGTATERQQPLPCRLQAPAGNAAVFPGQAPHLGEPFFLAMLPDLPEPSGACFSRRREKCRLPGPLQTVRKGVLAYRARWRPVRSFGKNACRAYRQGTYGGFPTRKALRQEPGGDRSGASPLGLSATGPGREPAGPPSLRSRSAVDTGRSRGKASRPPGKERLFASGACHLRAFGLWKLVHRSTLRQRPGVPGNALRRIFRCLPVMGPGVAAGRVAGSGPVWKITTLLED